MAEVSSGVNGIHAGRRVFKKCYSVKIFGNFKKSISKIDKIFSLNWSQFLRNLIYKLKSLSKTYNKCVTHKNITTRDGATPLSMVNLLSVAL